MKKLCTFTLALMTSPIFCMQTPAAANQQTQPTKVQLLKANTLKEAAFEIGACLLETGVGVVEGLSAIIVAAWVSGMIFTRLTGRSRHYIAQGDRKIFFCTIPTIVTALYGTTKISTLISEIKDGDTIILTRALPFIAKCAGAAIGFYFMTPGWLREN